MLWADFHFMFCEAPPSCYLKILTFKKLYMLLLIIILSPEFSRLQLLNVTGQGKGFSLCYVHPEESSA